MEVVDAEGARPIAIVQLKDAPQPRNLPLAQRGAPRRRQPVDQRGGERAQRVGVGHPLHRDHDVLEPPVGLVAPARRGVIRRDQHVVGPVERRALVEVRAVAREAAGREEALRGPRRAIARARRASTRRKRRRHRERAERPLARGLVVSHVPLSYKLLGLVRGLGLDVTLLLPLQLLLLLVLVLVLLLLLLLKGERQLCGRLGLQKVRRRCGGA